MKRNQSIEKSKKRDPRKRRIANLIFISSAVLLLLLCLVLFVPFGTYDFSTQPQPIVSKGESFTYPIPLDPHSPWAKFRANELQNGRAPVEPAGNDLLPWVYRTGKGIFSSPVIDAEGNVYIGSADTFLYKLDPQGQVIWKVKTDGIIDSSALLDDQGRVFFGSGDSHVYCLDRESGEILWKSKAHTVEEVTEIYGMETYNVNWFEGNIGILADGRIIAPNDNYLVYALNVDNGTQDQVFLSNEMVWSLPAQNLQTGRIFFASANQILKNVFAYDLAGERKWLSGSFGTVAATSMLSNASEKGAVLVGGFDGFLRAFAQDSGKLLWKFGTKDHIYASPAQLSDGTIVQASTDGTLYAIDPETGRSIWEFDTLEPIRSSPAVDGRDNIYFGNGEGKLYCIHPDGTLRWSYQLIDEVRNDLNGSPALGFDGVSIAGESGEVFFVPYDYPLSETGRADPRSDVAGEKMPMDGAHLIYTTTFGSLLLEPEKELDANAPVTLSLVVREDGDTILSALDRKSVQVEIPGNTDFRVEVGATNKFINIVPDETWNPDENGNLTMTVTADYRTRLQRFGLKFFGGRKTGTISQTFTFRVQKRDGIQDPFLTAQEDARQSVLEFSRLSAPTPSMLPSYNQIGFDSLHYIGGLVGRNAQGQSLMWVIEGKPDEKNQTVIDPEAITRFPLMVEVEDGLVTMANYDGFKIKFIGSWDMPFASYRISAPLDEHGRLQGDADLIAVADCDKIEFYGIGLKLVGMSEFKTGKMFVRAGTRVTQWADAQAPQGTGSVEVTIGEDVIVADFSDTTLMADEHVYSLAALDELGNPLPLYYTKHTSIEENADGTIKSISLTLGEDEDVSTLKTVVVLVDTYPIYFEE